MTLTNLWQQLKDNSSSVMLASLACSATGALFALGASSTSTAAQHKTTEEWAAWMGANLTEALRTGNNATILYVIDEMHRMEEHCVNSAAHDTTKATAQYIFASVFLAGAMLYTGSKIKNMLCPPKSTAEQLPLIN